MLKRVAALLVPSLVLAAPASSADGASATIVTVDSAGDVGRDSSIELSTDGSPVISYLDETNAQLVLATCTDQSCASSTRTVLDPGGVGGDTSLELRADRPVVAYHFGNLDLSTGDLRVARCTSPGCTTGVRRRAPDRMGFTGLGPALALASQGRPVVSYVSVDTGLRILSCGDQACRSGNTIADLDPDVFATPTGLALDAAGIPVIAYSGFGGLRVIRCGNTTCTAGNMAATPAPQGSFGWQGGVSLALDSTAIPVVAFFSWDGTTSSLHILRCGNPQCTASNSIATVPGWVGGGVSLTLGEDDLAVVSFVDASGGGLRVLRCTDMVCAAFTNVLVDPDSGAGFDSSIVLDSSDRAVVSYHASNSGDLRVAFCATATCA